MMDTDCKKIIALMDLTLLDPKAELPDLASLCQKAQTPDGEVAAVCVYPEWVAFCKEALHHTKIQVATVVNFPGGEASLHAIETELDHALHYGADEIDLVFPYHRFLLGEILACEDILDLVRQKTKGRILKVILETGAFHNFHALEKACELILDFAPDYLKTSTGKIPVGATPEAFQVMLQAIAKKREACGVKISGGIHDLNQARHYLALAEQMFGKDYLEPRFFRIGTSRLLDALYPKK